MNKIKITLGITALAIFMVGIGIVNFAMAGRTTATPVKRSGNAVISNPSGLTMGTEASPWAGGYFTILNASTSKITNLKISGASTGNLDMGGFQITNAGAINAYNLTTTRYTPAGTAELSLYSGGVTGIGRVGTTYSALPSLGLFTNSLPRIAIDNAGKVGIGNTSPYANKSLTIGNAGQSPIAGADGIYLDLASGGGLYIGDNGNTAQGKFEVYGGTMGIGTMTTHPLGLWTDNAERMTILAGSGNVGIATTSPSTLLDIFSTATTTITYDSNSASQGSCLKLKDYDGGGYTYLVVLNGTGTFSQTDCSI